MHDLDHRGVNNNFLIKTNDPLAITYNDQSPLVRAGWIADCVVGARLSLLMCPSLRLPRVV